MTLQELRNPLRRGIAVLHPNRQRLKAFQQHPGVERAHRRAGVAHQLLHRTVDVLLVAEDGAAQHPALTVDVLGARVHHHVDPERKALLQQRRGKHVVQHHLCARGVSHIGHRGDVDQRLHRIRRRLEEHRLGGHRQRLLPLRKVVAVDEDGLHAPTRQDLVAHHEARPEQAARGDQPVTGAQQRAQRDEHRGHAARGARMPPGLPRSGAAAPRTCVTVGLP